MEGPKVIVGTIHSVKGSEADDVVLFPNLSQAGEASYEAAEPSSNTRAISLKSGGIPYTGAQRAGRVWHFSARWM